MDVPNFRGLSMEEQVDRAIARHKTGGQYDNPIIRGFNPDPSIVRVESDFFLVTSSFEYYPGLPIYHSKDLIRWDLIGHAITRTSQLRIATPEPGGGLWAPTIRWHDGAFFVLCSSFERYRPQDDDRVWPQPFYVTTADIWDSRAWSDPIYFDQIGFDPDIFWDDDGKVYLSTTYRRYPQVYPKDFAIHIGTVDLRTGNSTSEPKCVRASSSGVAEGSHIVKRGQYYYLFTAEGGTESGHCECVFRSKISPIGPYERCPNNPLWRNTAQDEVQNTGHADLVEDADGNWWAVLLAVRPKSSGYISGMSKSVFGRETFLVPVDWTDDGWPRFNNGRYITLDGRANSKMVYKLPEREHWSDNFADGTRDLGWYRKNTPLKPDYDLLPGILRLYGSAYSLSSPACPTLFLRKQFKIEGLWSVRLSFNPTSPRCEAGTCVYWNYLTHASIGIRLAEPDEPSSEGSEEPVRRQIVFTLTYPRTPYYGLKTPSVQTEQHTWPLRHTDSDVMLFIQCSGIAYRLGWYEILPSEKNDPTFGKNRKELSRKATYSDKAVASTYTMTRDPPAGAAFTGMMLGLYAFGENKPCLTPVDFSRVEFDGTLRSIERELISTPTPTSTQELIADAERELERMGASNVTLEELVESSRGGTELMIPPLPPPPPRAPHRFPRPPGL